MLGVSDWIKEAHPQPDVMGFPAATLTSITFHKQINRNTLTERNILILDGNNGGRLISSRFLYRYEADTKTLIIYLKEDSDRLDSNHMIEIIMTGRISDVRNRKMEVPYHLRITTR
ncbi:hypothetical protein [Cohnella terricola]|uniref:SbsA Ig-like domain-containing protein n=1 Tax=Cohnella terricola TaxID=1289167 RepID=A0A559JMQ6_9BACL|nr:hypothetical protein [Cohnella terricola]TVY01161.1 hypothetical protein FPZ45_08385 [Cohnella terricola]